MVGKVERAVLSLHGMSTRDSLDAYAVEKPQIYNENYRTNLYGDTSLLGKRDAIIALSDILSYEAPADMFSQQKAPKMQVVGTTCKQDATSYHKQRHREYSKIWRRKKKEEAAIMKKAAMDLSIFRTLAEEAPDMLSVHSANTSAVFLYASRAFCRQLGVEPSRLLGLSLLDMVSSEDHSKVSEALIAATADENHVIVSYQFSIQNHAVYVFESSARLGQQGLILSTKLRGLSPSTRIENMQSESLPCEDLPASPDPYPISPKYENVPSPGPFP